MELDHIFLFIEPDGEEIQRMREAGFIESHRRVHAGQGTANVCFGLDNCFVELLWITSPEEACSPPIARTRLFERAQWRSNGACPFGISWRSAMAPPFKTWPFRPPYLPLNIPILTSTASDDPEQPFMFAAPSATARDPWRDQALQKERRRSGVVSAQIEAFELPMDTPISDDLRVLARSLGFKMPESSDGDYGMTLRIEDETGRAVGVFRLPDCRFETWI